MMKRSPVAFAFAIALFAIGCQSSTDTTTSDTTATPSPKGTTGAPASTTGTAPGTTATASNLTGYPAVQAIFNSNCMPCHGGPKGKAKVDLTGYDAEIKSGDSGPVIVPGDPAKSKLVLVIAADGKPHMPPKKNLSDADIKTISDWVKAGAKST